MEGARQRESQVRLIDIACGDRVLDRDKCPGIAAGGQRGIEWADIGPPPAFAISVPGEPCEDICGRDLAVGCKSGEPYQRPRRTDARIGKRRQARFERQPCFIGDPPGEVMSCLVQHPDPCQRGRHFTGAAGNHDLQRALIKPGRACALRASIVKQDEGIGHSRAP